MDQQEKNVLPDPIEDNDGQRDEDAQAHSVTGEARVRSTDLSEDSERGGRPNPAQIIPDDTPDLVERMEEMNRSGHIDFDAYAGEPSMDDEEGALAQADTEDLDDELDMIEQEDEEEG